MSILLECDQGWIISHPKFFDSLKILNVSRAQEDDLSVPASGMNCSLFRLNPNLFGIKDQFIKNKTTTEKDTLLPADQAQNIDDQDVLSPCKKVNVWPDFQTEVHRLFREIVAIGHSVTCFSDNDTNDTYQCQEEEAGRKNNFIARRTAAEFLKIPHAGIFHSEVKLSGANSTDYTVLHCISGQEFLFPPRTAFYCGDISRILEEDLLGKESFDFVLMDPPWMNKYIWRNRKRRHAEGGGYEMIDNLQLEGMRIDRICNDGALIAVWCTNAAAHHNDLVQKIFPAWHVTYLTTWYWVKVTKSGKPILPFQPINKKQPYEILVIGQYKTSSDDVKMEIPERDPLSSSNALAVSFTSDPIFSDLRKMKVIVSVPSSIHSHKPPVIDILRKYLPEDPKCCELFARYLVPGFTSLGNEVFKLQHKTLYVQVQDEKEKQERSHL